MAFATFQGEHSVTEIASKLFVKLTAAQRKQAEAAILKANPELRHIAKLKPGTLLRIPPELSGLRPAKRRELEQPEALIAGTLTDALSAYGKRIAERMEADRTQITTQQQLLKSSDFTKAIAGEPKLKEAAKSLQAVLATRAKASAQREKALAAALEQAMKDLDERAG